MFFVLLPYDQQSHFSSLVLPCKTPNNFGGCPYNHGIQIFKNLYLGQKLYDRFGDFGKVVGIGKIINNFHNKNFFFFQKTYFLRLLNRIYIDNYQAYIKKGEMQNPEQTEIT